MVENEASTQAWATPQAEHEWLKQLIGEWSYESPAHDGTDTKYVGVETVTSVGELWIQAVGEGEAPGGETAKMVMVVGYDPGQGKFVGTWFGSMMHYLWVYRGSLDESRSTLTLESVGLDFENPSRTRNYRDIIHLVSPDHRTLTGMVQRPDGGWTQMTVTHYRRR